MGAKIWAIGVDDLKAQRNGRRKELEQAIRRYIAYYNSRRIEEWLGWLSPVEYRLRHAVA